MPDGDAQVIRALYRALRARDPHALRELLADGVEWHGPSPLMPAGGGYSGSDAVVEALTAGTGAAYLELALEPEEVFESGGLVCGRGAIAVRFRGGDETITDTFLHLARIEDGRIAFSLLRCDSARLLQGMPGTVVGTIG